MNHQFIQLLIIAVYVFHGPPLVFLNFECVYISLYWYRERERGRVNMCVSKSLYFSVKPGRSLRLAGKIAKRKEYDNHCHRSAEGMTPPTSCCVPSLALAIWGSYSMSQCGMCELAPAVPPFTSGRFPKTPRVHLSSKFIDFQIVHSLLASYLEMTCFHI